MKRSSLVVERMTTRALWARAYLMIGRVRLAQYESFQERNLMLDQVDACLKEIQLRGEQLALFPHGEGKL